MKADNRYVPFLDGFRGYAILLVILGHLYRDFIKVALLGVTLFFFVSGFLITKLLIFEFKKRNTIRLKEFYLRRIFRLYPALVFFLIVTCGFILISGRAIVFPDIFAGLFYFTNYYLVYFKPVLSVDYPLVSEILWSLSVEEHFYLFFPLLFLLLFSNTNNRLAYTLTTLLILFLISRCFEYFREADLSEVRKIIYYTTHNRADSILYGCISAMLIYRYNPGWYLKILTSRLFFTMAVLLIVVVEFVPSPFFQNTFKYSLQGISFSVIIPYCLFLDRDRLFKKLLEGKLILFIGKLSYSLYLFHWISIKIVEFYFPVKGTIANLLIIAAALILSITSYYGVEKPFLAYRRKFGSNA